MSDPPGMPEVRPGSPFPGIAALAAACRQLTFAGPTGGFRVDASAVYFPLIGAVLGAVWVMVDRSVASVAGMPVASVAVALVAAALTRGRGVIALARTSRAIFASRPRRLEALEAAAGVTVWIAAAVALAAEIAVIAALARFRLVGLAFAPVLGCCSMVVLAIGSRAARADGRRLKFAPDLTFREFGVATTATFALLFLTTEFLGLLLVLATAAFTIGARVAWHRWLGGVTGTALLATAEATQLMVLALLVAIA